MADEKLKPCPWCGKEMEGPVSVSEGSTFRWRKVDGCCTDGPEVRHNTMTDAQTEAEAESRAKAIAAWNERAPILPKKHTPQLCRECGQPTMHLGDICFGCGKAAKASHNT